MTQKGFVITIDGPAGSGKSTVSQLLAQRLHFNFLTTGAFYRGLGVLCQMHNIPIEDQERVARMARYENFIVTANVEGTQVFVDDQNVTDQLNSEKVARVASIISAYPEVRRELLSAQRAFNLPPGLIAEGRDCGTVVFPEAPVKIFLTASLDTRAQRRSNEEAGLGDKAKERLAKRDQADTARKVAPLAKSSEAIEIDTSTMSIEEVVDKIEEIVKNKRR